MASYLKPQSPIIYKTDYIYPLTTYDQIIMPDGSRWDGQSEYAWEDIVNKPVSFLPAEHQHGLEEIKDLSDNLSVINNNISKSKNVVNLLDNSDFRNPINQRGIQSGASIPAYTYCLDRWQNFNSTPGTLTLTDAGIQFEFTNLSQTLPDTVKTGTVVTAAAQWSDGTIVTVTGKITRGNSWTWFTSAVNGHQIGVIDQGNGVESQFTIIGGSGVVVWAALYEGAYTADTLPAYQPKGYAAELAECMRYYQRMPRHGIAPYYCGTDMRVYTITFNTEMRVIPTMNILESIEYNDGNWGSTNAAIAISADTTKSGVITASGTVPAGNRPHVSISYEASADL